MRTGDGLLARLHPRGRRLTGAQLAGLARAAADCGNGLLEIGARGSLQIRGLTQETAPRLAQAVAALGVEDEAGLTVETGALAGLDAREERDPRPLARRIRAGADRLAHRLGPKVSVTVDGGGALPLTGIGADVKLEAVAGGWIARVGAACFGPFAPDAAVEAALLVLRALAETGREARARHLEPAAWASLGPAIGHESAPAALPVGRFALKDGRWARGLALAFGQIEAAALADFARQAGEDIRLAPGRGLLILHESPAEDAAILGAAARAGLVGQEGDSRLLVSACAGAPACAGALLPARRIAAELARMRPGRRLHVSGCGKECARPPAPVISLVGREGECDIRAEGEGPSGELRALLARLGAEGLNWKEGRG